MAFFGRRLGREGATEGRSDLEIVVEEEEGGGATDVAHFVIK